MAVVEYFLLAGLGLWLGVGAAYALGVRLPVPGLVWAARFRAVVQWEVFSANARGSTSTATYRFEIRDSEGGGSPAWKAVAEGHARWVWYGFLWQPQRRLADGLRYFARAIGSSEESPEAISVKRGAEAVVSDYLAKVSPPEPGQVRETRLVVRRFSTALGEPPGCELGASSPVAPSTPSGGLVAVSERTVAFSGESHDAPLR